ncbi:hypothetical protein Tco_0786555 [Tanacetum coccineum]
MVGLILLDHCLSHALTETAEVPAVYLQQFWKTVSKLIIADLMKKFPNNTKRLEEDYHSIKYDVPLMSVYTTGNVLVQGMLIPDALLTAEIRETNDFKEYETVSPIVYASPSVSMKRKQIIGEFSSPQQSLKITIKQKQTVEKDDDDSKDRIEPGSHKDNSEVVDDDDDKEREKQDGEIGSLEIRNEETQTTIPTPLSSPRKILSSDKKTFHELTDIVSNPTISTSKHLHVKKRISSKYSHLPGALRRMCMHQGYMIQDMKRKCVTTAKFWETHNMIDSILHEVVPQIAENVTNDLIEANLKPCIVNTIIEDRDAFHSSADLQHQLGSSSKLSRKDSTTYVSKQQSQHQEWDAWEEENVVDEDEVILEDVTPELIAESQNVDKRVPTIFDHARMEATLRDSLEVVRIVTDQPHGLDFMKQILVMRANDKPDSFSKADFKYLNKNDIEDLYYLCRSKENDNRKGKLMNSLLTFIKSCVIWERVHDFQLGIESYQMKVNLTAPTLTFPGIEEHVSYTIVDKPQMGLIYLNSKDEKRVMYLEEIVKFCDAILEKVLNEVKLRMFESKFLKKPPMLGELDQDIMKAYEREISMRLSHRQQMRRWESFVNGRPILPMMKRL